MDARIDTPDNRRPGLFGGPFLAWAGVVVLFLAGAALYVNSLPSSAKHVRAVPASATAQRGMDVPSYPAGLDRGDGARPKTATRARGGLPSYRTPSYRTPPVAAWGPEPVTGSGPEPVLPIAATPSDTPTSGTFSARSVPTSPDDAPLARTWQIVRNCAGAQCTFVMTRTIAGGITQSGRLVPEAHMWRVTFTPYYYSWCWCHGRRDHWRSQATYRIHFDDGGRSATAYESNHRTSACSDTTKRTEWRGTRVEL